MWSGIWFMATTRVGLWTWIWPTRHYSLRTWMPEKHNMFHLTGLIIIDVQMHVSFLEERVSFKMLRLSFCSKLWWDSYIFCIGNVTKRVGALIRSIKFSSQVALYLYKSTIRPCMNTVAMSWLVLPVNRISFIDGYVELLVLHFLSLLDPWLIFQL